MVRPDRFAGRRPDLLVREVSEKRDYQETRKRALKRLEEGFSLGGSPLSREEIHER